MYITFFKLFISTCNIGAKINIFLDILRYSMIFSGILNNLLKFHRKIRKSFNVLEMEIILHRLLLHKVGRS